MEIVLVSRTEASCLGGKTRLCVTVGETMRIDDRPESISNSDSDVG